MQGRYAPVIPGSRGDPNNGPNARIASVHTVGVARQVLELRIRKSQGSGVKHAVPFGPTSIGSDQGGNLHIKQWQPLLAFKNTFINTPSLQIQLGTAIDPNRLVPTFTSFNGINWISNKPGTPGYKSKEQFLDELVCVGVSTDTYTIGQDVQHESNMGALVQGYVGIQLTGTEALAPGDLVEWTVPFWTQAEKDEYDTKRKQANAVSLEHWPADYHPPKLQRYDTEKRCEEETAGAIRAAWNLLRTDRLKGFELDLKPFLSLPKTNTPEYTLKQSAILGLTYMKRDITTLLIATSLGSETEAEKLARGIFKEGRVSADEDARLYTFLARLYHFHLVDSSGEALKPHFDKEFKTLNDLHMGFARAHYYTVWGTIQRSRSRVLCKCVAHQRPMSKFESIW